LRPRAENNLRQGLALNHLVISEQVSVNEDEVSTQIRRLVSYYGQGDSAFEANLDTEQARQSIAFNLLTAKGVARLMSICKGENPPLPAAEESAPTTDAPAAQEETIAPINDGQVDKVTG